MLVMMTVDRFQAICYPLTNQGRLTHPLTHSSAQVGVQTNLARLGVGNEAPSELALAHLCESALI